ncbi:DUF5916 domain-containing protein [Mangrovimonas futianensis]|uniref:DUF5916 domain-containing protein n=1 Tax=Mangrovimonas futianensis TaxID=2895523 RepID=UPI001E3F55A0|nr:DUF5916 domain-containing protein [Mangrovimonas futianensis]MCF1422100.1 carbohydrate binding family 9 domain-containing protein [Mangrovimonas futianensis]
MKTNLLWVLFFLGVLTIQAQNKDKKQLHIQRTETAPKIDGVLDDVAWVNAEAATDFVQFRPDVGNAPKDYQTTQVKVTYDDHAIYFAAYLYDHPDEIMKQFNQRDNFGQQDFFGVVLNPNNDAQNDAEFFVFPTGNQADASYSPYNGEDFSWNSVWDSAVKLVDDGWIVEIKIPYRCLRFANKEVQTWGLQFHRHFRTTREQYTWNPIDPTKGNIGLYHGEIIGIENISPPTRLSFYPFASTILESYDGEFEDTYNIGLDLKYGISENFTLDATLIPDFSQAAFDDVVLNLGPFEQTFAEQRQFFTEGVDLFNKGNLFYSRRVGGAPVGNVELEENEQIREYPTKIKTLNALKVSGRTKKGLGIGVFNAITEKTYATIENVLNGETRKELIEPLANYNIFVLDQQFNKNSTVSLINTNVTRNGHFRDGNVTAGLLNYTNKSNTYNVDAQFKMSNINEEDGTKTGWSSILGISEISGNYRFSLYNTMADDDFDINDLGVNLRNNYNNFSADASYRIFEPTEKLNNFYVGVWANYNRLYDPGTYTGMNLGASFNATNKKINSYGANINFEPGKQYDYFEARTKGKYFIYENWYNFNLWYSSNYNKTFALDTNFGGAGLIETGRDMFNYWFGVSPRFKLSDRLLIVYDFQFDNVNGDRGYTTKYQEEIVFGQRDQRTIVNSLSGSYNFNAYHALTLTFRNYWSTVNYNDELFTLQDNGHLSKELGLQKSDINDPDINFNTWNLDFGYSWQFAPGSQLSALYRNQLFSYTSESLKTYGRSMKDLFNEPFQHVFSLKLIYFIDYNDLKQAFKKNENS